MFSSIFLSALGLGALQLLAALHHGLHLGLHLADVEARHRELLVDQPAALVLLRWVGVGKEEEGKAQVRQNTANVHSTVK